LPKRSQEVFITRRRQNRAVMRGVGKRKRGEEGWVDGKKNGDYEFCYLKSSNEERGGKKMWGAGKKKKA